MLDLSEAVMLKQFWIEHIFAAILQYQVTNIIFFVFRRPHNMQVE